MTEKTYINPPKNCDLCHNEIKGCFYDAKTRMGPWGNLCSTCFGAYGLGLGTGLGQKYMARQEMGEDDTPITKWVKVDG